VDICQSHCRELDRCTNAHIQQASSRLVSKCFGFELGLFLAVFLQCVCLCVIYELWYRFDCRMHNICCSVSLLFLSDLSGRITAIARCGLLLYGRSSVVCLCVCLLVTLKKRMNRSRCCLGGWLRWTQGTVLDGVQIPQGNGQFWGLYDPLKCIVSHCFSVHNKKSITASARLLWQPAMLPTGRRHITWSPVKICPPSAMRPLVKILWPLVARTCSFLLFWKASVASVTDWQNRLTVDMCIALC